MTQAIRLRLRASRWLVGGLVMLHAAALAAAFASLSSWVLLLVVTGVVMSTVAVFRAARLVLPESVHELELSADRSGRWRQKSGDIHEFTLAREGFACAWLVVLALDATAPGTVIQSRRRWVVLAPDSADQEELRQLRVWLRAHHTLGIPPDNHAAG